MFRMFGGWVRLGWKGDTGLARRAGCPLGDIVTPLPVVTLSWYEEQQWFDCG